MLDQNDNLPQADGQSPNESIHEKIDSNVNEVFSQIENSFILSFTYKLTLNCNNFIFSFL